MDLFAPLAHAIKAARNDPFHTKESAGLFCGLTGIARATISRDGIAAIGCGPECFVVPVLSGLHLCRLAACPIPPRDAAGDPLDLVDLCLWNPSRGKIGTVMGNAIALGEEQLDLWGECRELKVWDNPASWLNAGCVGIVPLDLEACADILLQWPRLVCETTSLGLAVEQAVSEARERAMPPSPQVMVNNIAA